MTECLLSAIGEQPRLDGRARRGVVMVIVLSVLLILAMMGVVFVTFQTLEKRVAVNYTDDVRSKMLAQSGIESAIGELNRVFSSGGGFSYTDIGGTSVANAGGEWVFFGSETNETLPAQPDTPIEQAANPSFAVELDADPSNGPAAAAPRAMTINGTAGRGISGSMATGTYGINSDIYILKILDESGSINVNDGLRWGATHSVSQNLKRYLNVLGAVLGQGNIGDSIVNNRPANGYVNKQDLLTTAFAGNQALYDAVKDFLTVRSWSDPNVANPVPLSQYEVTKAGSLYPTAITYVRPTFTSNDGSTKRYRHGHQANWNEVYSTQPLRMFDTALVASNISHNAIWQHDSLNPNWIEVVERSPVNVNTAPKEVLVALIADLQGFYSSIERRRNRPMTYDNASTISNYVWLGQVYTYDAGGRGPNLSQTPPTSAVTGGSDGDGDETGFIYPTVKFVNSTTPGSGQVSAQLIADHIIACRQRGTLGGINYSLQPFGGPFRTWAQFNAFVDYLARRDKMIVWDNRGVSWFFDHQESLVSSSFSYAKYGTVSWTQQRMAAQAAADALKANFNPNLHLNELNPDRHVYTYVDKTDLIVNSTEFCFVNSTGSFRIESLGMVLQPDTIGADAWGSPNNTVAAQRKAVVEVKLYDAFRITSMHDFYNPPGYADRAGSYETNNNYSVEVGPEVDSGPITTIADPSPGAADTRPYRWEGYVALPTYGGAYHTAGVHKAQNTYVSTTSDAGVYPGFADPAIQVTGPYKSNESMHNHFTYDGTCHYHRDRDKLSLQDAVGLSWGGWLLSYNGNTADWPDLWYNTDPYIGSASGNLNHPDWTENTALKSPGYAVEGTYYPIDGARWQPAPGGAFMSGRQRLSNSFTMADGASSFAFSPAAAFAPHDLRIDGHYMEKGSSVAYMINDIQAWQNNYTNSTARNISSWTMMQGTAAFWIKPNWFPEQTGKIRTLWSNSRYRGHIDLWQGMGGGLTIKPNDSGHVAPGAGDSLVRCNNYSDSVPQHENITPFTLYYLPAHSASAGTVPSLHDNLNAPNFAYVFGAGEFRPASLGFGTSMKGIRGTMWDVDMWSTGVFDYTTLNTHTVTPSLNHEGHGSTENYDPLRGEDSGFNHLRGHEWTHIAVSWKLPTPGAVNQGNGTSMQIFVNGQLVPGSKGVYDTSSGWSGDSFTHAPDLFVDSNIQPSSGWQINRWTMNDVKLGGETDEMVYNRGIGWNRTRSQAPIPRAFTADATMDEFFMWTDPAANLAPLYNVSGRALLTAARDQYDQIGRYYVPTDTTNGALTDATITTRIGAIKLAAAGGGRALPPATTSASPPPDPEGGGGGSGVNLTPPGGGGAATRIVGVSWTVLAEAYNPPAYGAVTVGKSMIPYLYNWKTPTAPAVIVQPNIDLPAQPAQNVPFKGVVLGDMYLVVGGTQLGPFRDEGYSAVRAPGGSPFSVTTGQENNLQVRYRFRVGTSVASTVLLASPVLDDVTIYYDRGGPEFVSYHFED